MIGVLLAYVRRGDVEAVYSLRHGAAEARQTVAHGDRQSSRVVGRCVRELRLPEGTQIGAIVRGDGEGEEAHSSSRITTPSSKPTITSSCSCRTSACGREVERLFQGRATFL